MIFSYFHPNFGRNQELSTILCLHPIPTIKKMYDKVHVIMYGQSQCQRYFHKRCPKQDALFGPKPMIVLSRQLLLLAKPMSQLATHGILMLEKYAILGNIMLERT